MGMGSPIKGLGYRQRVVLALLHEQNGPLAFRHIVRLCVAENPSNRAVPSAKTVCVALRGLLGRGLVKHVRYGWWALA